jgi:AcrR family transcriptional regulator
LAHEILNLNEIDGVIPANQARSRDAQARLLKAGEKVFARVGYDAARVSDIAEAADCSIGSFYRRFRDKEALFHALQTQFARRGRENIDAFFDMPRWREAPVVEVLRTLVLNTARLMERNPGFFRALFQRSLEGAGATYFPALAAADVHAGQRLAAFLGARGAARLDDMETACTFALQAVEAVLLHRLLHGGAKGSVTDPATVDPLTRLMMNYLELSKEA